MQRVRALFLGLFQEVTEAQHLDGGSGRTTVGQRVEPVMACLGQFHLDAGQPLGRRLAVLDGPAVGFEGDLFGPLTQGEDGLQFELERLHGISDLMLV